MAEKKRILNGSNRSRAAKEIKALQRAQKLESQSRRLRKRCSKL